MIHVTGTRGALVVYVFLTIGKTNVALICCNLCNSKKINSKMNLDASLSTGYQQLLWTV